MERYVYEMARGVASRGHDVSVLCRAVGADTKEDGFALEKILVPTKTAKRGWQDRVFFARAVADYVSSQTDKLSRFDLVHSHENTTCQHVSTEHGPCTLAGLKRAPWKLADYSAIRNLMLERAKFAAPKLAALVCCSARVEASVLAAYPAVRGKLCTVIPPADAYLNSAARKSRDGFTLGFIGADWKRKGLRKALEIFRCLRAFDPRWTMIIAGKEASQLPRKLTAGLPDGASIAGRVDPESFYGMVDVLLHPAKEEPYGMVVGEALSAGVPTVVSDRCGCVHHLRATGLRVMDLNSGVSHWADACVGARRQRAGLESPRSWADVAREHEELYEQVLSAR